MFNLSATLNVSRLFYSPSLAIPHLVVKTFDQLPVPLEIPGHLNTKIKGLVIDKDNCFAKDHDDKVWPQYNETWTKIRQSYQNDYILIVSNSAGTNDDIGYKQALELEANTGVKVLRHPTKKPGCHDEILQYFAKLNVKSTEIAVIGDRLFTDILMANMMGSYGVWLRDGVEQSQKLFPKLERNFYDYFVTNRSNNPLLPPSPKN